MIEFINVTKSYPNGDVVIDSLDLVVNPGDFIVITGKSGAGKTTIGRLLIKDLIPNKGKIIFDGEDLAKIPPKKIPLLRRKIGFIFQAFNLLPRTTTLANVMLPMSYAGVPKQQREERAKKYLEMVGLKDRMYHTSNQISGGQQQRVAIARALVMNPSILLADEPTGNIATTQAEEIMAIFTKLNKEGHTIVMITHEPDIAKHAKRIIHIRDGKII